MLKKNDVVGYGDSLYIVTSVDENGGLMMRHAGSQDQFVYFDDYGDFVDKLSLYTEDENGNIAPTEVPSPPTKFSKKSIRKHGMV